MRLRLAIAVLCAIVLGAPSAVRAQSAPPMGEVIFKITIEDLADLITKSGMYSEIDDGQKFIVSDAFIYGWRTHIIPDFCDADGCAGVRFVTWFPVKSDPAWLPWLNAWNLKEPGLVKGSLQGDHLRFEMMIYLFKGATRNYIKQSALAYITLVNQRGKFKP